MDYWDKMLDEMNKAVDREQAEREAYFSKTCSGGEDGPPDGDLARAYDRLARAGVVCEF